MIKPILILLGICSIPTLYAQQSGFQPFFTAITVKNIDTSISWYSKVLNLKLRNRTDNAERGFKQAVLIDQGILIELVELKKMISADSLLLSQPSGTNLMGFYKFGMTVPNIDGLFQRFVEQGIQLHGRMVKDPIDNKKTFLVKDPDGNLIQFFER